MKTLLPSVFTPIVNRAAAPAALDRAYGVFFLGVGGAFTDCFHTNMLVTPPAAHATDDILAIDIGTGWRKRCRDFACFDTKRVKTIVITHCHPDHVGGLADLLLHDRWVTKTRRKLVVPEGLRHTLWDMTLAGQLADASTSRTDKLENYCDVITGWSGSHAGRETYQFKWAGTTVTLMRTCHAPAEAKSWQDATPSFGVYLDEPKVLFTGDTKFDRDLLDSYPEASRIFHDASFKPSGVHATLDELRSLPENIRRKMILDHYQDDPNLAPEPGVFGGLAVEGMMYACELK